MKLTFIYPLLLLLTTLHGLRLNGAEPRESIEKQAAGASDAVEVVDFFKALEEGRIDVRFIPKDASQATLIIKNNGKQPLDIPRPGAFGAVHVLGQMGGMGMGGMGGMGMGGMGGMGMGGGQGMGGGMGGMGGMGMGGMGMGGMGGGMGMGGMGGGMFRVAPDKPTKLSVPCVCLEHGKTDPNPRMKYKIVPIEQINGDPRVAELCALLGQGHVPQNTAQAATWHMANGLSWEQLANKNRIESQYTGNVRFFSPAELQAAYLLAGNIDRFFSEQDSGRSTSVSARYRSK
ncbi:MAG: hypothetical protein KF752_11460 [Pirellulaceae bacterium]|nr:hypothetical protein [Pirellulaceae bacterium]